MTPDPFNRQFYTRPVEVRAVQLTDENWKQVANAIAGEWSHYIWLGPIRIYFEPLDGDGDDGKFADAGDWIIRHADGTLSICKPDVFAETYQEAGVGTITTCATVTTFSAIDERKIRPDFFALPDVISLHPTLP